MTPWLAVARAVANSFRCANRADRCQKVGFPDTSAQTKRLSAPSGSIGPKGPIGTDASRWSARGLAVALNADSITEAHACGWRVEVCQVGWLIDRRGQPSNPALVDRLYTAMLADQPDDRQALRWPVVRVEPTELVLRGAMAEIEREAVQ